MFQRLESFGALVVKWVLGIAWLGRRLQNGLFQCLESFGALVVKYVLSAPTYQKDRAC
jgi:hypothetical protein